MTTKPTTEYVTDVEHEAGCRHQRDQSLYLMRTTIQVQPSIVTQDALCADDSWKVEDVTEPVSLCCTGCNATKYVHINKYDEIVRLTNDTCPRGGGTLYKHNINYDRKPCEYCGFTK